MTYAAIRIGEVDPANADVPFVSSSVNYGLKDCFWVFNAPSNSFYETLLYYPLKPADSTYAV